MWSLPPLVAIVALGAPSLQSNAFAYEQVGATEIEYTAGRAIQVEVQGSARFNVNTIIRVRGTAANKPDATGKLQTQVRLKAIDSAMPIRVEGLGRGAALRVSGSDLDGFLLCDLFASVKPLIGRTFEVSWSNGSKSQHAIES